MVERRDSQATARINRQGRSRSPKHAETVRARASSSTSSWQIAADRSRLQQIAAHRSRSRQIAARQIAARRSGANNHIYLSALHHTHVWLSLPDARRTQAQGHRAVSSRERVACAGGRPCRVLDQEPRLYAPAILYHGCGGGAPNWMHRTGMGSRDGEAIHFNTGTSRVTIPH